MPEGVVAIASAIITGICSIIVAALGIFMKNSQKESDRRSKLEQENRELKAKEQEQIIENQNTAILQIGEKVDNLTEAVEEIKSSDGAKRLESSVERLLELSSVNFEYSQSLSGVIASIGDTLSEDDNLETSKLDQALEKHRCAERELMNRIYKVRY